MVDAADYQPLSGDAPVIANMQEFFLQGSVLDTCVDKIHERLQGLCDNVSPEAFTDHERTYVMRNTTSNMPITVKACQSLVDKSAAPWQIKYMGNTDVGDRTKSAMIRSSVSVAVSKDPSEFLEDLGFVLQFEVILKGYFYRKGRLKITVAKLSGSIDPSKHEAGNMSHLIELSALASPLDESAGDEVRIFSQFLRPIVYLDKVDVRRLQQKTAN
ncbi:blcap protein [Ciona intestinalis]